MTKKNINKAKRIIFIQAIGFIAIILLPLIVVLWLDYITPSTIRSSEYWEFYLILILPISSVIGFIFRRILTFIYNDLLSEYEGYLKSLNNPINRYSLNQDIKENNISNKLNNLETMLNDGIINEEEYNSMRQKIIDKF